VRYAKLCVKLYFAQGTNLFEGLTFGEAVRRIRKRLGKNTTQFAAIIGSTASSISRYENGKLAPGVPVAMLLRNLAETDDEKGPIEAFIEGRYANPSVAAADNPISAIREVSRLAPAVFSAMLGCSESSIRRFESGEAKPPRDVVERLQSLAVRYGHADLAVSAGENWKVRRVVHPGETLISTAKIDVEKGGGENRPIRAPVATMWHDLLDEILGSGNEDAIIAVQHNLVVFGNYVRAHRKSPKKKKTG
jgi:transcriptional regulator with XRE-family HTH domain